jgi:hypothetical protein
MSEILDGWELSEWTVRRAVKEGQLRRVRRPGYQPYYPLSSVVAAFGSPKHPITPRYRMWAEAEERAA